MEAKAEIGRPEGRTQYSDYAEKRYEEHRESRESLSASEYAAVLQGYLREYVCMGQCNIMIAAARDPELKEAIRIYLNDVCNPNFEELKEILERGGYELPASVENVKSPDEVADVETDAIDDRMIALGQFFATRAFMNLWNTGAIMSQRTDVRDAFIRNYHRANRWHMAFYNLAVQKGHLEPLPNVDAKGLVEQVARRPSAEMSPKSVT